MSRESVEIVRQSAKAFLSGDMETALRLYDPEGEFTSRFSAMEGRTYRGVDGVRQYLVDIQDAWKSFDREVEELVDAGDDTVLAVVNIRAVSRAQGVPLEQRVGIGYWVREGRITRMVSYPTVEEARGALGLAD